MKPCRANTGDGYTVIKIVNSVEIDVTTKPLWEDTELERIKELAPAGWHLWHIRQTLHNGSRIAWCAKPEGASKAVLDCDSPDELLRKIDDDSWLPKAIQETREMLDRTPGEWTFERDTLSAQLESLLAEQRRRSAMK
jgi:hypothetical protein